jgi:predicted nucleotidyltransferase
MRRIEELSEISDVDREMLHEVKRIVQRFVPDAELWLYGSSARGERHPESDWDVLALTNRQLTRAEQDEIRGVIYDLELERTVLVMLRFYSREEWETSLVSVSPFRENVERDAITL